MAPKPVDVKKSAPPSGMQIPAAWESMLAEPEMWLSFRSEFDRLLDRFTGALPGSRPRLGGHAPAVDITETKDAWLVKAELPGLDEADVEVALCGDQLTLSGEKHEEHETADATCCVSERRYGRFSRSFAVPEGVDREAISASFRKGVLTITLPKREEAKAEPRRIAVKTEA
jgi:HSP20 family protein